MKRPETESWLEPSFLSPQRLSGSGLVTLTTWMARKPVMKLEPIRPETLASWMNHPALSNPRERRRRQRRPEDPEIFEVFVGRDPHLVEEAVRLSEVMEDPATPHQVWVEATTRVGVLLGYPECCSRAFALEDSLIRESYFWMHVARRLESPDQVPWELNPAQGHLIDYVPCSLSCPHSLEMARANLASIRWDRPQEQEAFIQGLQNPFLLFSQVQSTFIELLPDRNPGSRMGYRCGRSEGDSREIALVREGDELVLEGTALKVLRQGRLLGTLEEKAFLWWHGNPVEAGGWRDLVRELKTKEPQGAEVPGELKRLIGILGELSKESTSFAGFKLGPGESTRKGDLVLTLLSDTERVVLRAEIATEGRKALFKVGPWALSYPNESPLESPSQWAAARNLVEQLQNRIGAVLPR